jgi:hypothetical protein
VVARIEIESTFPKAWEEQLVRAFEVNPLEVHDISPPPSYHT